MFRRLCTGVIGAVSIAATVVVAAPAAPAMAANLSFSVSSPRLAGVGIDAPGTAYNPCTDQVGANSTFVKSLSATTAKIRVELYPGGCSTDYDQWGNVGGIHFEVPRGAGGHYDAGAVRLPEAPHDGFQMHGDILSSSPIPNGRVKVDTFQVADFQLATVPYGAFASTTSKGARWSGGVGWGGTYLMFIEDTATGRKITAHTYIDGNSIPTIDLDAICFGFDTCNYTAGGPGTTSGTFHPTAPTRIFDTRISIGTFFGAVTTGDGRHPSLDPTTRAIETANHHIQVTGRNGIPSSGVSAVLLNVTAVDAPGTGYLSLVPKPPRVGDVFNDQGSYGAFPSTSNLNVGGSDAVPNLVLARVGAGGQIRIFNSFGPTNVVADVAGWFGTGGAHTDGAGFRGIDPIRVLDTRNGIGGPRQRVAAGQSRVIPVRGVGGIPKNAESVVVNVTSVGASGSGYATAFPDGTSLPNASNLNYGPSGVRANTAVVKIGKNGAIRLQASETETDFVVDVLGSFGPYGGKVTAITPERLVDTRHGIGTSASKFGQFESRELQIAGRGSVPSGATAVIANVTATNPSALGYLTAWPSGKARPTTSNLNFLAGQSVPNLVIMKLGSRGRMSIFNELGTTDVIVDVMGYVT